MIPSKEGPGGSSFSFSTHDTLHPYPWTSNHYFNKNMRCTIFVSMKKLYSAFIFLLLLLASTQTWSQRYLQPIFSSVQTQANVSYGNALAWDGTPTPLAMDVYRPQGDSLTLRPVMLFFHGG